MALKGIIPKNVLRGELRGEKHPLWKGEKASYRTIHRWVEVRLGKPRFCENCGNKTLKHRQYHWSNISGHYKRVITDWRRLCAKCHVAFDKANGRWANSTGRPRKS